MTLSRLHRKGRTLRSTVHPEIHSEGPTRRATAPLELGKVQKSSGRFRIRTRAQNRCPVQGAALFFRLIKVTDPRSCMDGKSASSAAAKRGRPVTSFPGLPDRKPQACPEGSGSSPFPPRPEPKCPPGAATRRLHRPMRDGAAAEGGWGRGVALACSPCPGHSGET